MWQKIIPHQLMINFDKTGLKIVPTSEWTLKVKGSKNCSIVALDDKREITVYIRITLTGSSLPFQLTNKGLNEICHTSFSFQKIGTSLSLKITDRPPKTVIKYAKKVLILYVE